MSRPDADPAGPLPPPAVSLALLVVPVLLASALGVAVAGDNVLAGDVAALDAVQGVDLPGLDALVALSNLLFSTGGALVLAALLIAAAWRRRQPGLIRQLLVVMAIRLAWEIWKPLFDSPRPASAYQPDPARVPETLGYPSGHAQTAAVVACMLVALARALDLPRPLRWAAVAGGVLVIALALFSRIHIGAHWPSDTLGGVLYGIGAVALMQLAVGALARRAPGAAGGRGR